MTVNALNPMYINWVTKSAHLFLSSKINGSNKLLVGCKNKQTKNKKKEKISKQLFNLIARKRGKNTSVSLLFNTDSILTQFIASFDLKG